MLELVRNTLGDWKTLKVKNGNFIQWQYLCELHNLQQIEGLYLANKLRSAHIRWQPHKMKVNLAAQTLSTSVADALDSCNDHLNLPHFSYIRLMTSIIVVNKYIKFAQGNYS